MHSVIAKTFTPFYDEIEDRIKLIVNYQNFNNRVDLMITRKFIIKLIPSLEEFYSLYYKNSINTVNNDSNKFFSPTQIEDISLYQKENLLLTEVNVNFNNGITNMEFKTSSVTVVSAFNQQTLHAFISNLKNSIPKIGWGIGF